MDISGHRGTHRPEVYPQVHTEGAHLWNDTWPSGYMSTYSLQEVSCLATGYRLSARGVHDLCGQSVGPPHIPEHGKCACLWKDFLQGPMQNAATGSNSSMGRKLEEGLHTYTYSGLGPHPFHTRACARGNGLAGRGWGTQAEIKGTEKVPLRVMSRALSREG